MSQAHPRLHPLVAPRRLRNDARMSSNAFVRSHWLHRSPLSRALLPLAWLYGAALRLRYGLYRLGLLRAQRLPVPVIVVGNFIVGGTGKTPLTIWLVEQLRAAGWRAGVVSRGYGGTAENVAVDRGGDPAKYGDEPVLLAERLAEPVWIGRDRVAAAQALLAAHPQIDVVVCDDGLQHLRLARDFEIALLDERGAGNGWLLPAGPLRERPRSVDAIVQRGAAKARGAVGMRLVPTTLVSLIDPRQRLAPTALLGRRVHAVAGIGVPERFFATLGELGLTAQTHAFPDHHRFTPGELAFSDCDALLMTEKDAVKCRAFAKPHWYALQVEAQLDESLMQRIVAHLQSLPR